MEPEEPSVHSPVNLFDATAASTPAAAQPRPIPQVLVIQAMRERQRSARMQLTTTVKHIYRLIRERGSRHVISAQLLELKALLESAKEIHQKILGLLTLDTDTAAQTEKHLNYTTKVHELDEAVVACLLERADDPASIITAGSHRSSPSSVAAPLHFSQLRPTPLDRMRIDAQHKDAAQRSADDAAARAFADATARVSAAARQRAVAEHEAQEAERALHELVLSETASTVATPDAVPRLPSHHSLPPGHAVRRWIDKSDRHEWDAIPIIEEDEEPAEWIIRFVSGREAPYYDDPSGPQFSTAPLPVKFSGRALDWFTFAENFYAAVHHTRKSTAEKLMLLKRCIDGGPAEPLVIGAGAAAYKQGLKRLMDEFGKRDIINAALRQEVDAISIPRDAAGFKKSALQIRALLFELSRIRGANNDDLIPILLRKLKQPDLLTWNEARGVHRDARTLSDFGNWLCQRAEAYQDILSIVEEQRNSGNRPSGGGGNNRGGRYQQARTHATGADIPATQAAPVPSTITAIAAATDATVRSPPPRGPLRSVGPPKTPYCLRCDGPHWLQDCGDFQKMSSENRLIFCTKRSLCYVCFIARHSPLSCWSKKACGVHGCTEFHHPLLHGASVVPVKSHRITGGEIENVALGCIQLDVLSPTGERVAANVMYDECSNVSFVRQALAHRLGLEGSNHIVQVSGALGHKSSSVSKKVELRLLSALDGSEFIIDAYTMSVVADPVPITDWASIKSRWGHMSDLPLAKSGGRVDVLLGLNHAHLMGVLPHGSRYGVAKQPIASLTPLGWIARGVVGNNGIIPKARSCHAHVGVEDFGPGIVTLLRRFCDTEDFGTEHKAPCVSPENQRAVRMLEEGIKKLPVGYEAPILWKEGEPSLRNNRRMAEGRNRSLLNRFHRDPDYESKYRAAMQKNFDEGYAVRLTDAELAVGCQSNYLPHFGVPKADVPRIVFDAAARSQGRSMNDCISPGPPLQNPLPAVVIRFREGAVAVASDMKAMYSRIRLRPEDMPFHRFLWTEPDGSTSDCQFTRLTFGVNCSPFVAIRTTWRAVEDAGPDYADAIKVVKENAYVDDLLLSGKDLAAVVRKADLTERALAAGDFPLAEFVSNHPEFLSTLRGTATPSLATPRAIGDDDPEAVLGLMWWAVRDTLGFRIRGLDQVTYTRLGLTSKLLSLFDPLGMAAPLTVKGKIRIRRLGTQGADWHDPVTGEELSWWEGLFALMQQLVNVGVPRCLFPDEDSITTTEMHTFCDASEEAYCAVVYIRSVYEDGHVVIRHVKASTKLAPIKTISVQKLELCAALLGARVAHFVQAALNRPLDARFFWTDSSTVRHWTRAEAAWYQTFVSNRIGEIQTLTLPNEWRFVPGRINPADAATRSSLETEAIPHSWLFGPTFLHNERSTWPTDIPFKASSEEMKLTRSHAAIALAGFNWDNVTITTDMIPQVVRLEGEYLELIKRAQTESFNEELDRTAKGQPLRPSSALLSLSPVIGPEGLLRLGGRLGGAALPYDSRHPVLLSGRHPLARKIIQAFHERVQHLGTDLVLTQVRQHFWITGGREAVKRVRHNCPRCILQRAKPAVQLMVQLPDCKLEAEAPPFSQTAVDYFGPIFISSATKRWGALFTCKVTRATYIDMASKMSSEAFLMILRRFIAIYGKPKDLYSDNGTNFVGAERELREAIEAINSPGFAKDYMVAERINWHFQPAGTPHFGGDHESMVKQAKRALYSALESEKRQNRYQMDDTLRTLLFEVAGLLNSRPLTYSSSDPDDIRPLTPNDFLNRPPAADIRSRAPDDGVKPKDRYKYVLKMKQMFWNLWRGPYLQSRVARLKWKTTQPNMAVGDRVAEVDRNLKPGKWRTGRIVKVYPGADGLVRTVDVELGDGIYTRGIQQLALLESSTVPTVPANPVSGEHGAAHFED